jgi:hypothetical protein
MRAGSNVIDYGVDWGLRSFIDCIVMRPLVTQISSFRQTETLFYVTGPLRYSRKGAMNLDCGALTGSPLALERP